MTNTHLMSRKYIRENKNSFSISRKSRTYGKFESLDDAVFIRDALVESDWNLDEITGTYEIGDEYVTLGVIDEKIYMLSKSAERPSQEEVESLIKSKSRNPNNSRYGLNITRVFDTFIIKKQIFGMEQIFGYYDSLDDAEFVRNFLMDHMWNVNELSQIEHDKESGTYRIVEVIDDKAYVLDTFKNEDEIDLEKSHKNFLTKISKHKYGLASHAYLDELKDRIPELEKRFSVSADDEVWSFEDASDPLNDIIFNLTPFQQAVFDAVDGSTFDEITDSLKRFRSKNFEAKISRNLDELEDMGIIKKEGDIYKKSK